LKFAAANLFFASAENYYSGSFAQLVCGYIRSTGMTRQEVERLLEEMRKVKGA
jgi:hypothetical protein